MSDLTVSDLRPFIPASDFTLSRKFYAALGWETHDVADGLALVRLAEQQHFYIQDYYLKEVAENSMLHLSVADAQAWYRHVSAILEGKRYADARVQPPKLQPYGALVTFVHDPCGVLLHLCEWRPEQRVRTKGVENQAGVARFRGSATTARGRAWDKPGKGHAG